MARRPALDERLVVNIRPAWNGEHIYLRDLARFLAVHRGHVHKLAKRLGLWRAGATFRDPDWVTPYGAMRLIAHIRASQQARYEKGERVHEEQARDRAWKKKKLAKLRAGTDAEPQLRGGATAVGEAVAETPVVSGSVPERS